MADIMMLADPSWFAFHERNSVGGLAIFYASPDKWTNRKELDPLFCVRRGKIPRSIVGVGRIRAQPLIEHDAAWAKYGTALGANTEDEWRAQASDVLDKCRKLKKHKGQILAIELIDFQPFPEPVSQEDVGLEDKSWQKTKNVGDQATALLLQLLGGLLEQLPPDSAEIVYLKQQLDELMSGGRPLAPEALRRVKRLLEVYERPSSMTRYVKRTRGTTCQLCGEFGFVKRNGKRYCEVHHLFHLSKNPPPYCLEPEYLVVLCATCHRRMHYADVGEPEREGEGWRVRVDEVEHRFTVEATAPVKEVFPTKGRFAQAGSPIV